jgi:hypothetical protein
MTNQHDPRDDPNADVQLAITGPRPMVDVRFRELLGQIGDLILERVDDLGDGRRNIEFRWPTPASRRGPRT